MRTHRDQRQHNESYVLSKINITRVMWLKSGNRYQIRFDANKKRAQQKAFRRSFFEKMYERRFCHAIF